jgi:hypothetical protein
MSTHSRNSSSGSSSLAVTVAWDRIAVASQTVIRSTVFSSDAARSVLARVVRTSSMNWPGMWPRTDPASAA